MVDLNVKMIKLTSCKVRFDWQVVFLMQEAHWPFYKRLSFIFQIISICEGEYYHSIHKCFSLFFFNDLFAPSSDGP